MLARSPSSFLDSVSVQSLSDDFAADGPLFAELLDTVGCDTLELEPDENINIMELSSDSEDEMERYFSGKRSSSEKNEQNARLKETVGFSKSATYSLRRKPKPPLVTRQDNNNCIENSGKSSLNEIVTSSKSTPPATMLCNSSNNEYSTNNSLIETDLSKKLSPGIVQVELPCINREDNNSKNSADSLCMTKNAVAARENRQKKKQYVESLERKCERLSRENLMLKTDTEAKDKKLASMATEIEYLRNVIRNESALSGLLKNLHCTAGLRFGTSFAQNDMFQNLKRSSDIIKDELQSANGNENRRKRPKTVTHKLSTKSTPSPSSSQVFEGPITPCASPELKSTGGVCLHVSNNNVSLEFCSTCASNAAEVWKVSGDHTYNRVIRQEVCDYVEGYAVIKQECDESDD